MNKNRTLWVVIAVIVIIGGLVLYRQWQMDRVIASLDNNLTNGLLDQPVKAGGVEYLVPPEYVFDSGADLPALYDPEYITVQEADDDLSDAVNGIDLVIDGQHYFYSYQILNWHEVVNQTVGDETYVITHCMLCGTSAVYVANNTFTHAGKVYNNNLLLEDEVTGSYWNQATGLAIAGDMIGVQLNTISYDVMTWGAWKKANPFGQVLSVDTGYDRDYGRHPFENYDVADIYYFPMNQIDDRVSAKWVVDGFEAGDLSVAFSRNIMRGTWVMNFEANETHFVALYDTQDDVTRVFASGDKRFTYDQEDDVFVDQNGGTWSAKGTSLSGSEQLEQWQTQTSFYMCWYANHTDTKVAFIDFADDEEGSNE